MSEMNLLAFLNLLEDLLEDLLNGKPSQNLRGLSRSTTRLV